MIFFCEDYGIPWNRGDDFVLLGISFNVNISKMVAINYDKALLKMKSLINSWSKRNISTLGRITVLKTLIIPHINYPLLTLPSPSDEFLSNLNSLFYNFVWNAKPDRISRNQAVQSYADGGLKMVDVRNHAIALKVTCIKRILRNSCNVVPLCFHSDDMLKFGNVYFSDLAERTSNLFWKDVFASIYIYLKNYNDMVEDPQLIASQFIWNNSHINISNCPIIYKKWIDRGVCIVNDLLNNDGTFLSFNDFSRIYQVKTNFLEYISVINAIKTSWG